MLIYNISDYRYGIYMSFRQVSLSREHYSNGWLNGIAKVLGHKVTFFDIQSTKAKQFGYCMELGNGKILTCCGDEPLTAAVEKYAAGSEWMLHEAFCLYSQADLFDPYEKHHSTVKDACELAERLKVKNLLLYHTEDKNLRERKRLYSEEGSSCYNGNLYVPDDLEVIEIASATLLQGDSTDYGIRSASWPAICEKSQ